MEKEPTTENTPGRNYMHRYTSTTENVRSIGVSQNFWCPYCGCVRILLLTIHSSTPDRRFRVEIIQLASLPVSADSCDFHKKPSWRDVVVDGARPPMPFWIEWVLLSLAGVFYALLNPIGVLCTLYRTLVSTTLSLPPWGLDENPHHALKIWRHKTRRRSHIISPSTTTSLQEGFFWKSQLTTLTGKLANCTISIRIPPSEGVGMADEMFRAIMKRPIT